MAGVGVGKVNVTSQGQTGDVYLNVVFITGHLIEAEVDFDNVGTPSRPDVQAALVANVVARAAAASPARPLRRMGLSHRLVVSPQFSQMLASRARAPGQS